MKKYIFTLLLVSSGYLCHSQVLITLIFGDKLNSDGLEFGLEGGFNWSQIAEMETDKTLGTLNLGFYFDIRLKDPLYLYTGVMVKSSFGVDELTTNDLTFLDADVYVEEGDYRQTLSYFNIPIFARYKIKRRFYLEAGPQVGWLRNAWVEFRSDVEGKEAKVKEFNKDMVNRIDFGLAGGLGYRLAPGRAGMTLGLKYYYGLVDVYKDRSGTNNSALSLKLNIPIGAKSKEEVENGG